MPADIRDLLKEAALEPSFDVEVERLYVRGRRARVRNVTLGTAVAMVVLISGSTLAMSMLGSDEPLPPVIGQKEDTEPEATEPEEARPSETDPEESDRETGQEPGQPACDLPPFEPTHLPWLEEGEQVGEPHVVREGTSEQPDAELVWVDDPEAYEEARADGQPYLGGQVSISTAVEFESDAPEVADFPEVEVAGHAGRLIWTGDPGIGGGGVSWREADEPCAAYRVAFPQSMGIVDHLDLDSALDAGEETTVVAEALDAELLRIAAALERR